MNIKFANGELKEVNMENNFVQGVHGKYNFYVIAFDSQNHFTNYGNEHIDLTLKQAQEIYSKTVLENPKHVNTMLGVAYSAEKLERDRYGTDAVDLLQCIDGKIKLCEDYKQSPLLSAEGFIAVNTVNILKKSIGDWQKQLDKNSSQKSVSHQKPHSISSQSNSLLGKLRNNQARLNESEHSDGTSAYLENI